MRFYLRQRQRTCQQWPPVLVPFWCKTKFCRRIVHDSLQDLIGKYLSAKHTQVCLRFIFVPQKWNWACCLLESTSVRHRDNQKIVLAAVQQDTAFKTVCQNLAASIPVVSHIALHQYHANWNSIIMYHSYWKAHTPRDVIACSPFMSFSFWGRLCVVFKQALPMLTPTVFWSERKVLGVFSRFLWTTTSYLQVLAGKCSPIDALVCWLQSHWTAQDWTALQFASPGARRNHAIALAAMGQVQQYRHGSFGQGRWRCNKVIMEW